MATTRTASHVEASDERAHQPLPILLTDGYAKVHILGRRTRLGFGAERSQPAMRAFVNELYRVSRLIDRRQGQIVPPDDPTDADAQADWEARLEETLFLEEDTADDRLPKLVELGAGLRSDLSGEFVQALKNRGFPAAEAPEEPALTFIQEENEAPVFWDMLYEGSEADPVDWTRFWGLRAPITHWVVDADRINEIRLCRDTGIFLATHESLRFAGREVNLLAGQLNLDVRRRSLAEAFREQVRAGLRDGGLVAPDEEAAWWEARGASGWLGHFFERYEPNAAKRRTRSDNWKKSALVAICKEAFAADLIHFACHAAGADAQYLSRLDLKIDGEPVSLSVSLMANDLSRGEIAYADRGPLVFLNACSTGDPRGANDPPGLPDKWINDRGALAVIATLCDVPDYFAYAFAKKFYEILLAAVARPDQPGSARNQYVAEALLATRRYFMETYHNPLGLAYVLYAIMGAHVVADFPIGAPP